MGKVVPLLLALVGLAGGVTAGLALKPPTEEPAEAAPAEASGETEDAPGDTGAQHAASTSAPAGGPAGGVSEGEADPGAFEYVKLNNQFVVPVVGDGRVRSLVVMSVSLQVMAGGRETVFSREPKLRDAFLQVLFDHANTGGFDGSFTNSETLNTLRRALGETARRILGDSVSDVLITDMMRQDT